MDQSGFKNANTRNHEKEKDNSKKNFLREYG
jgi:hypothetical protein